MKAGRYNKLCQTPGPGLTQFISTCEFRRFSKKDLLSLLRHSLLQLLCWETSSERVNFFGRDILGYVKKKKKKWPTFSVEAVDRDDIYKGRSLSHREGV